MAITVNTVYVFWGIIYENRKKEIAEIGSGPFFPDNATAVGAPAQIIKKILNTQVEPNNWAYEKQNSLIVCMEA